ncbi:MAG: outer membrane lipoprotein-sorting protein [Pseudomonadota bacterium]
MRSLARAIFLFCLFWGYPVQAGTIEEIVQKADLAIRGETSAALFEMEIKTASYVRRFKVVSWDDSRAEERMLIKILGPALWRGFGTLKIGPQLKLYNPRSNHVTVVGNSMLGDSWMGSHFSNDDLVKETKLAHHFHCKVLKKWPGQTESGKHATFYNIELRPKPTAPVAWGKIVYQVWEQNDLVMPIRAEYFQKTDHKKPVRWMTFSEVKHLGGRLVPSKFKIELASKTGEYTQIVYQKLKFDVAIPSTKFTEQELRR